MKITDEELLDAIWQAQLRATAKGVIHYYIGGGIGLCNDNDTWYKHSCDLHVIERSQITKKIGDQQLLKRLRSLVDKGFILSLYGKRLLTFMVDKNSAWLAFKDAREFWLDHGVPEGSNEGVMNTTKDVNVDDLLSRCQKMLLGKYGDQR